MRRIANKEIRSQNTTHMTNVSTRERTLMDITNAIPTNALDFAQRRSIVNKNCYQRQEILEKQPKYV